MTWRGKRTRIQNTSKTTLVAAILSAFLAYTPVISWAEELNIAPDARENGRMNNAVKGLGSHPLDGPDSTSTMIRTGQEDKDDMLDRNFLEPWEEWKAGITEETGLSFGFDYTSVGLYATDSLGKDNAASGILRFFGSWELLNRNSTDTGGLSFKIETRDAYTSVAPFALGGQLGYAGTPQPVFNDQGFRATTLYWRQHMLSDRAVLRAGFLDVKEYFDVYALASPWSGFNNLAFSTGSNAMLQLPDGALGVMFGGYVSDNFYMATSILDASADPDAMFGGFDTFFSDFDTFKTLEVGYTGGGKTFFLDNVHVALWQVDESKENGTPDGWGINVSASRLIDEKWLPFLRGAWTDEGGSAYERSISGGFGYMNKPGGNLLGVALNWGRPNSDTLAPAAALGFDLDDQWTAEAFYRFQLTENFQITPSIQLLKDPVLNPQDDFIALFGLRARVTF